MHVFSDSIVLWRWLHENNWNEMNTGDKIVIVIRIVISIVVVVLASLQLFGVLEQAINYAVPLLGVYLLILSVQEWKHKRGSAILSICLALFIFIVSYVVFFVD